MTYAFHPQIFSCPEIWALPATEFKLYAALLTFCRPDGTGCFPKNETLAEMVGSSEATVTRNLKSLEDAGIITRLFTNERNGRKGTFRDVRVNYTVTTARGTAILEGTDTYQRQIDQQDSQRGDAPHIFDTPTPSKMIGNASSKMIGYPLKNEEAKEHSHLTIPYGNKQTEVVVDGVSEMTTLPAVKANTQPVLTSRPLRPAPAPVNVGSLNARMMQLTSGREYELMGHLSQDMVDCGYLEYALDELASRKGKVAKPVAWLIAIFRQYQPGWANPLKAAAQTVEDANAARRARIAAICSR